MPAALKVETIREDLGKVGPVIANQVEEAMLGHRAQLDTTRVEQDAEPGHPLCGGISGRGDQHRD